MSNSMLLFIFVFFFSCVKSFSSSYNTTHKCSVQQTQALLLFKQNLSSINSSLEYFGYSPCEDWLGFGYSPLMINWNKSTDCCDWNGVTCDHSTGDVVDLDLSCGMLQGTIHPNSALFHQFPRLQRLNLAHNYLRDSQLPPDIGRLSNSLTHLNISHCGFTGQVPADISHLHKLVSLDLSYSSNEFSLEPHVFINLLQNLTFLEELSLKFVNISSVLPSNLNLSSSLRLLDLGNTELQGNIPRRIFDFRSLEKLDLWGNSFTGYIPSEVSLLTKLVSLRLSYNGMDNLLIQPHILSMLLQNSTTLSDLRLAEVNIGVVLPTYLNISAPLRSLDLSSTNLSGEIASSISHLTSLDYLDLSYCRLNGSLPESLVNLKHLRTLDLSSNMFSGTLPSSLFTLTSLETIRLSNNQLTGHIDVLDDGPVPQTFQKLTNLTELDLSNNRFRGDWELDILLSSLANLEKLILSHSGVSVTTNNSNHYVNPSFRTLRLASCSLKVFPLALKSMKNLYSLDLSNNDIQGHIPNWIGEIGKNMMVVFDLSNNSITGTIPNVYGAWWRLEGFILREKDENGLFLTRFPQSVPKKSFCHKMSSTYGRPRPAFTVGRP